MIEPQIFATGERFRRIRGSQIIYAQLTERTWFGGKTFAERLVEPPSLYRRSPLPGPQCSQSTFDNDCFRREGEGFARMYATTDGDEFLMRCFVRVKEIYPLTAECWEFA